MFILFQFLFYRFKINLQLITFRNWDCKRSSHIVIFYKNSKILQEFAEVLCNFYLKVALLKYFFREIFSLRF